MPSMDAGLDLLDREILDVDNQPVGKVDDLELSDPADGPPRIEALLLGTSAYGTRLGGRLGRWLQHGGSRLAGTEAPIRIPMTMVAEIDVSVRLSVAVASLPRATQVEDWLRDRFVGRIPGAHRAAE